MSHDFIRICERSPCLASGPNPTKEIGQPIYVTPQHDVNVHILGKMHFEQGRRTEAIICFREVLRRDPHNAEAYNDLGIALVKSQKIPEGAECFQQALLINPKLASALINKGNVFRTQGELEEAIACYRQAMEVEPHNIRAHNNLVYALYSCPGQNAGSLAAELRRWNERHAEPLARFIEPHRNDKTPERRLRIGYLSPDFRLHPVGRFMLTLLKAHDHAAFEICCYSSLSRADEWTNACRKHADVWREVRGWSDEQVANTIRGDRVDIMVDLTMHMANCRLLVFARKPAPVQVTYLAYPGTTGLATMDYRLTDKYLDPPGQVPRFYSEESVYLPDSFWCYEEVSADLALSPPPASKSGHITFGCLNNFCKGMESRLTIRL